MESRRYAGHLIIYMFWSFYDGVFQAYAYWLMGSLSNNSRRLSYYSGWYKSIQSAAAAVVWRLDGLKTPYHTMYLSTWIILAVSVITTSYVSFFKVLEHSTDEAKSDQIPVVLSADASLPVEQTSLDFDQKA